MTVASRLDESELARVVRVNSAEIARLLQKFDMREVQPFDYSWLISNGT